MINDPIAFARDVSPEEDSMRVAAATFLTKEFTEGKDVFQFGVWTGRSMVQLQKLWKLNGLSMRTFWGFDSFEGLPHEANDRVGDPAWVKGAFSSLEHFKTDSQEEVMKTLHSIFDPTFNTILVPGYWETSLTDEVASQAKPASYIDVDCDIYSSAVTCLDWLLRNKIIGSGTLVGYHDWGSGGPRGGEQRAHREMLAKHNVRADQVWFNGPNSIWRFK